MSLKTNTAVPEAHGSVIVQAPMLPGTAGGSASGAGQLHNDGKYIVPGHHIACDNANMVTVRTATGDWCAQRTAAGAETFNFSLDFGALFTDRLGETFPNAPGGPFSAINGVMVTGVILIYSVLTAALTTHTVTGLNSIVYANNAANVVAAFGGTVTGALHTAAQAGGPYVDAVTFGTPAILSTDLAAVTFEWQVVMQNTGVFKLHRAVIYHSFSFN